MTASESDDVDVAASSSEDAATRRVREAAAARGLEIDLRQSARAASLEEAAALRGVTPSDIVKSLVVKGKGDQFLFALIPGDRSISWPKLRALLGVNKLRLPESHVAFEATGYERGTITPVGSTHDWPVYADERMVGRRVSMGAGAHGWYAALEADDLIRAYGATVADISEPVEAIR